MLKLVSVLFGISGSMLILMWYL